MGVFLSLINEEPSSRPKVHLNAATVDDDNYDDGLQSRCAVICIWVLGPERNARQSSVLMIQSWMGH